MELTNVNESYQTLVGLIERLHRHFLDVLRAELRRLGIDDINAVQALLLSNIGNDEMVIRDLKDRGYYHGSNVSYNIKKLTEMGYLAQERSPHDRRATVVRLSEKGLDLCNKIGDLNKHLADGLARDPDKEQGLENTTRTLQALERVWTDYIRFGR